MTIILLFPIMLICIGLLNLLILRSKRDRLSIFKKTERKNTASFISQLSNKKRKSNNTINIFERAVLKLVEMYVLLFGDVTSSTRLKNIGICAVGICAGIYANSNYFHLSIWIAILASFILVVIALFIFAKIALKKDFDTNFPEALNLVVGIVSSGNSLSQAIHDCGIKINGTVGSVFNEVSRRLDIGEDSERVLIDSYRRLPFKEYYFFVLVLIVNLQGGGEIKEIVYRLSKMITSNKLLERTRDSKTAELRMTVKILAVLPFVFIFLLKFIAPENFTFLFDDPVGNYVLYYVIGSVFFGLLIIRKMLSNIV